MSVTVNSIRIDSPLNCTSREPHIYITDCVAHVNVVKADVAMTLRFTLRAGFKVDGASVPFGFRWFLPTWSKDNDLYNVGASIHDALYIHKGFGVFSREECDDILRGIWRCSGISRFKAGVADLAIGAFAGGKSHWGNDSYGVGYLAELEW